MSTAGTQPEPLNECLKSWPVGFQLLMGATVSLMIEQGLVFLGAPRHLCGAGAEAKARCWNLCCEMITLAFSWEVGK